MQNVEEQAQLYTKWQIQKVNEAQSFQNIVGNPPKAVLIQAIQKNTINNDPITVDDVNCAEDIFEPNLQPWRTRKPQNKKSMPWLLIPVFPLKSLTNFMTLSHASIIFLWTWCQYLQQSLDILNFSPQNMCRVNPIKQSWRPLQSMHTKVAVWQHATSHDHLCTSILMSFCSCGLMVLWL